MDKLKITKETYQNPCAGCNVKGKKSACCQYVSLDTPTVKDHEGEDVIDHDTLYWFLTRPGMLVTGTYHEGSQEIYEDSEDWEVQLEIPCRYLSDDGKCSIYEYRPAVCSDHTAFAEIPSEDDKDPSHCERYEDADDDHEIEFRDAKSYLEFVNKEFDWHPNVEREPKEIDKSKLEIITKPQEEGENS
jgi:Fe-S-cluster containining protein